MEDAADLADAIEAELAADGHRVLRAADGPAALSLCRSERPDLVILDWMIPEPDGLEVLRRLRRDPACEAAVLMLTARGDETDRVVGLELGADDYLTKPFGMRELKARVRALLRRTERIRETLAADRRPEDAPLAYGPLRLPPAFPAVLAVFLLMLFIKLFFRDLHWMIWPSFAYIAEAGSPEFAGQGWWLIAAAVIWTLNMLLAEEIFFRGLLLPRMRKGFGRLDWPANALLYGAYYLAAPLVIPFRILLGMLAAGLARRYRSLRMALFVRGMEGVMVMVLVFLGFATEPVLPLASHPDLPHLDPGASAADWGNFGRVLSTVPAAPPGQTAPDVRFDDLSGLNLTGSAEIAAGDVTFNDGTVWPAADQLPENFDRGKILELGLNPGLGVRSLHAQGIDGRGVGIAIIDQPLLTSHEEIAGRLRWYEELSLEYGGLASMHGSAVTSLAAGRVSGAAPGADLYYFSDGDNLSTYLWQFHYVAAGIRRVLELNRVLPPEGQIRVISISPGWNPYCGAGWYDVAGAVEEARARGVLVVYTSMQFAYGVGYLGLDRSPLDDPDLFESYRIDPYFEPMYLSGKMPWKVILAPMNSRAAADPSGDDQYAFYRQGGLSWTTPWIAGVYALAVQADPSITPERFLELALETGRTIDGFRGGRRTNWGRFSIQWR